jgi:hypothetical protein
VRAELTIIAALSDCRRPEHPPRTYTAGAFCYLPTNAGPLGAGVGGRAGAAVDSITAAATATAAIVAITKITTLRKVSPSGRRRCVAIPESEHEPRSHQITRPGVSTLPGRAVTIVYLSVIVGMMVWACALHWPR